MSLHHIVLRAFSVVLLLSSFSRRLHSTADNTWEKKKGVAQAKDNTQGDCCSEQPLQLDFNSWHDDQEGEETLS